MNTSDRVEATLLWLTDAGASRTLYVSDSCQAVFGLPEEAMRRDPSAFLDLVVPEDRSRTTRWLAGTGRTEAATRFRIVRPDGEVRQISLRSFHLPREAEEGCVVAIAQDVTADGGGLAHVDLERREALILRRTPIILYTAERPEDLKAAWIGGSVERITGFPPEAFARRGFWLDRIHPDDRDLVIQAFADIRTRGEVEIEYRWLHANGTYRWIEDRATWTGVGLEIVGSGLDVTERKESEGRLRQLHKMESIGRLAGGVAHDFNNLLTVVLGNVDLALGTLRAGHPVRGDMLEIRAAARRAADLTRQLLAFSRRQILSPRDLSPNELVRGLESMLRRLVGESIVVSVTLDPGLGSVHADPGQLEQVLLNLALNAREAMPDGGRLFLSTRVWVVEDGSAAGGASIPPGRYAVLSMRDEGRGMTPEVQERIFEPFFTTKEPGQGTGLGLATVYGIVTQSGGYVTFRSESGRGTCFDIYLPLADHAIHEAGVGERAKGPGGGETVLLVEDEPAVRNLARRILSRAGYQVIEAQGPDEALEIAGEPDRRIDALVTDVVMPGMDGAELSRRVAALRPGIRMLFVSGYSEAWQRLGDPRDPTIAHLEKPFTGESLVEALRRILDAPGRPG